MSKRIFVPVETYRREGRQLEGAGYGIALALFVTLPVWLFIPADAAKPLLLGFIGCCAGLALCLAKYIRGLTDARIELCRFKARYGDEGNTAPSQSAEAQRKEPMTASGRAER